MVIFDIPELNDEMMRLIPDQRRVVNELLIEQQILSYSLAKDMKSLWTIITAESESELIMIIDKMPITPYVYYDYKELVFHNTIQGLPAVSLN